VPTVPRPHRIRVDHVMTGSDISATLTDVSL